MSNLPEKTVEMIRDMRSENISWQKISRIFGISYERARGALEPEYAKKRSVENSNKKRPEKNWGLNHSRRSLSNLSIKNDQDDTRDLTGIIMGDPFPGRSALDQKKAGAS